MMDASFFELYCKKTIPDVFFKGRLNENPSAFQ